MLRPQRLLRHVHDAEVGPVQPAIARQIFDDLPIQRQKE
jgi:hypothetical protein